MELWDAYDQARIIKNRTMIRGEDFKEGDFHLAVHICVFNSKGEMLVQQRQPFKEGWPDMWDVTTGGSAIAGETSQEAAERKLFEEVGIKIDLKDIRPNFTANFKYGFDDIYLVQKDVDIAGLTLQYEEVQRVKWAAMEEIFSLMDGKKFVEYHKSLIQLFFDTKGQYGCHVHEKS